MQVACRCHFSRAAVVHRTGFIKVSLYWKVDTASGGSPEFKLVVTTSFRSEAEHPHGCRIRALQVLCKCRLSRAAAVHRKAFKVSLYWAVDTASGAFAKIQTRRHDKFQLRSGTSVWLSDPRHARSCNCRLSRAAALRIRICWKTASTQTWGGAEGGCRFRLQTRHPSSFHFKTPGKGSF